VIDIDRNQLPCPVTVAGWTSEEFVHALEHEPSREAFNPHLRQLLHVGFKIAAKKGQRYLDLVRANRETVAAKVTNNLFDRHLKPVFVG
jgi:hypothetical protein